MRWLIIVLIYFSTGFSLFAQEDIKTVGQTSGKLPFLKFGPGTDRLGGAKMTYLDTGIYLNIVDSLKTDYIVQLSENHRAFIPKEYVGPLQLRNPPDYILTNSWSVYGDEAYDYVRIQLDQKLPYRSVQQINPSRIVIDVFGATGNTNWITQRSSTREIQNVYHEQIEDDVFRIYIDLKHETHWGYQLDYERNALVIRIKRQPEKKRLRDLKIAIDAGHGGKSTGARGPSGILEKDFTLLFAKALEAHLDRKGVETYMTRKKDIDISTIDRVIDLKNANPDILISLHLNSSGRKQVKGVSTYYRYIGFRPLTTKILERMLDLDLGEFGNVGSFNFTLNGPTEYPNCLVEIAFISNPEDEKRIQDPKFRKQVAKQITRGIKDWLRAQD